MAKSYDIADLMTSDGEYITDSVRRKINGNFRRVLQIMQQELPSQERQQIVTSVTAIVDNLFEQKLPELMDQLYDDAYPVGSVIVTSTSADPRLSHGSWESIGSGRYVLAAGDGVPVMSEGGEAEHDIVMTELPLEIRTQDLAAGADVALTYLMQNVAHPEANEPIPMQPEYIALLFYRRVS